VHPSLVTPPCKSRASAACLTFSVLALSLPAQASSWASFSYPDMVGASTIALRGTVTGTEQCLSDDEADAFTFVTLDVDEVLRGAPQLPTAGSFTFRLPVGEFPDATFATSVGYPRLQAGDDVLVFLTCSAAGEPLRWPLAFADLSLVRIIPGAGKDYVVDGAGAPFVYTDRPIFPQAAPVDGAHAYYWWEPAVDIQTAGAALDAVDVAAEWDGTGVATGDWSAVVVIHGTDVATGTTSTCNAHLSGTADAGSIHLVGRCNAEHVGAVEVSLDGTLDASGWSGTITLRASALPSEPRTTFVPNSASGNETFRRSLSGQTTEEGVTVDWTIDFQAFYAGTRPLATWQQYRDRLQGVLDALPPSTVAVPSISPGPAACNAPVALVEVNQ